MAVMQLCSLCFSSSLPEWRVSDGDSCTRGFVSTSVCWLVVQGYKKKQPTSGWFSMKFGRRTSHRRTYWVLNKDADAGVFK